MRFVWIVLIMLSCSYGDSFGQDDKKKEDPKPEVKKVEQPTAKPITEVIVIINSDDINKVLVVSVDGTWIPDARTVEIKTTVGAALDKPSVTCSLYKGIFAPSQPKRKTWKMASIMTAPNTEFQKILDGLQNGDFKLPE